MNSVDAKICRDVINNIRAKKYADCNYLFLDPVDTTYFPTYTKVVRKPMDLGSAAKNLEAGIYSSRQEFFADLELCYKNAETFHKDFPENQWIIQKGKELKKYLDKERKRAEKSHLTTTSEASVKKPKLKLSVKKPSSGDAASASSVKPKKKLSLKVKNPSSSSATTSSGTGSVQTPNETPVLKKPKIKLPKLKMSTSKKAVPPAATPSQPTTKPKKSSTKKETKKSSSTPKGSVGSNRGKELPSAVAEAKAAKKADGKKSSASKKINISIQNSMESSAKTPSLKISTKSIGKTSGSKASGKKIKITAKTSKTLATPALPNRTKIQLTLGGPGKIDMGDGTMTHNVKAQCYKVISSLQRVEFTEIVWFLEPVNDKAVIEDYRAKIANPMDLQTLTKKLDKSRHANVKEFVSDLRRIFGNCLRFNALAGDSYRPVARAIAKTSEELMHLFIQSNSAKPLYPKLLYCWNKCLTIIEDALSLKSPNNPLPAIHYFLHPVPFFLSGTYPEGYLDMVKTPMDFGTIQSKLMNAEYQDVRDFTQDCRLVITNCKTYHTGREESNFIMSQAEILEEFLFPRLEELESYDQKPKAASARQKSLNPPVPDLLKPRQDFMLSLLKFLKELQYKDSTTKIVEPAAFHFERPVNTQFITDYLQFVKVPMDISTVESNVMANKYIHAEDFEHDVMLIFRNCELYNVPKHNRHIVKLAKHCANNFRKQYFIRIKAFDASGGTTFMPQDKKDKKRSLDNEGVNNDLPASKKSRKTPINIPPVTAKPKPQKKALPRIIISTSGPLPLHVAIAKIKQDFPLRRPHKDLESWEGACSRFFRELKKHPWISSSKRFVFDAPVTLLHPEIKESYLALIKKPMDLTTAECKLLQGGIYSGPQEFVHDVALVFSNAEMFNKAGNEQGDPTSCAYYDASRHLLRYTRWLSLETISEFLIDDSGSEGAVERGPISQWRLSTSNLSDARKEMEEIVFSQVIDLSDEGDRSTWMEGECEKLLKVLRHQSDQKRMKYFLTPFYPADYFAYISKPMAWENIHQGLKERKYETFGDVIADLRLIFSNALKYNGRTKDTDPFSRDAYDSAQVMSDKLESAIKRSLITIGDRVEREKVEQVVLDREEEIERKEEEERMKKEWQEERERAETSEAGAPKIRQPAVKVRRSNVRKGLDFDFPFYEEEGSTEQSVIEVLSKQKALYEEQQSERIKMMKVTKHVARIVHHRLLERTQAIKWAVEMSDKVAANLAQNQASGGTGTSNAENCHNEGLNAPSNVSSFLQQEERSRIALTLMNKDIKKKKVKKRRRLFFE